MQIQQLLSCQILFYFTLFTAIFIDSTTSAYHGKLIGSLKSYHHGLGGDVYAVDSRTLHIRNFAYDGEGPAGYFYVSNGKTPNENGIKIRDENGSTGPLKRYRKKHITLTLPEGKSLNDYKWFYVWCDDFSVNFGDVKIPRGFDFPKPQKIGKLSGVHGVSSDNIVVVDAQTLLIPSFSYDGDAPDAKFWVGKGSKPSPQGIRIPDENGKEEPLRRYNRKTVVLTLPGDLTIFDIGHFGIWCEAFTVDFGHIPIPSSLNTPPSLKMLGVSPQSKLNCEVLYDDLAFEVRWAVAGDSIVIQLVAKLERGEYMSFGLSGQIDRNVMIGGDVVVAWVDQDTLNGYAYDYYLDSKSQCAGTHGSCPDEKLQMNTENIRLLNAALVNGYSIVTYQRPLRAHDSLDLPIYTNGSQAIVWAIGPLNSLQEVSYHSITSKERTLIDFGRPAQWNCPVPESDTPEALSEESEKEDDGDVMYVLPSKTTTEQNIITTRTSERNGNDRHTPRITTIKRVEATPAPAPKINAWDIPAIQCYEPDDGVFYAQMGPTGGKRGYSAITGHVGWGTSWYINGLLIPEINVVRGRTYTFVVEGGMDPEIPAKYHPFYITDDPLGGFHYKTPEEKAKVRIFAGASQDKDGEIVPTGTGRLCNWTPDQNQPPAEEFVSFGAYQRTLSLVCDHGEPGVIQWTPDQDTPDVVYYQCFTHRYLGWKINVHDSCDKEPAASEQVTSRLEANTSKYDDDDLQYKPSIRVATRVKPDVATPHSTKSSQLNQNQPNLYFVQPHLAENIKQDFTQDERVVLQDPFLLPPPYQKNFDYQYMQINPNIIDPALQTVSYRAGNPIIGTIQNQNYKQIQPKENNISSTPRVAATAYYVAPTSYYGYYQQPMLSNTTSNQTSYNVPPKSHPKPTSHKNSLVIPTGNLYQNTQMPQAKYQLPMMHLHRIKHSNEPHAPNVVATAPRPFRHSVVVKKPVRKVAIPIYLKYPMPTSNIVHSPVEPQSAASLITKTVVLPPHQIPIEQGISAYYHPPKKSYHVNSVKENKENVVTSNRGIIQNILIEVPEGRRNPTKNGFNPGSIVIESGFKPISPTLEPEKQPEERSDNANETEIEEKPITLQNKTRSENETINIFEKQEVEPFEPMFIPSPPINEIQKKKKRIRIPISRDTASNMKYNDGFYVKNKLNSGIPRHSVYSEYYTDNSILKENDKTSSIAASLPKTNNDMNKVISNNTSNEMTFDGATIKSNNNKEDEPDVNVTSPPINEMTIKARSYSVEKKISRKDHENDKKSFLIIIPHSTENTKSKSI